MQNWLLAEDNEDDAYLFRLALERVGGDITLATVKNGEEIVRYLSGDGEFQDRVRHPFPNCLFLDLKMPRMDGLDVLRWKQQQGNRDIKRLPTVMLTSSFLKMDIERAYDLGANSYVVKPSSMEGLTELVHALQNYWVKLNCSPEAGSSK